MRVEEGEKSSMCRTYSSIWQMGTQATLHHLRLDEAPIVRSGSGEI